MGFELIVGWTPEEPAPIALCDNPACGAPVIPADGWVIAALSPPNPARPGPPRADRTYLACSDACLAALRSRVGGAWSAPLPYGTYWRAIAPRAAAGRSDDAGLEGKREERAAVEASEAIVRDHQCRRER